MTSTISRPAPAKAGSRAASKDRISQFDIDVSAVELYQGLRAVMPHAHRSATIPAINVVHFDVYDGKLYLVATDRYTLGMYRCLDSGAGYVGWGSGGIPSTGKQDFSFSVPLDVCKLILADARQAGLQALRFTMLEHLDEDDKVEEVEVELKSSRLIRNITPETGSFPSYRTLLAGHVQAAQRADRAGALFTSVNKDLQAKFAAAGSANDSMVQHHVSSDKPTVLIVGQQFCGLIMPTRTSEQPVIPDWVPGSEAPAAAAAPVASEPAPASTPPAKKAVPAAAGPAVPPAAGPTPRPVRPVAPAARAAVHRVADATKSAGHKVAGGVIEGASTTKAVADKVAGEVAEGAAATKAAGRKVVSSGPVRRITPGKAA